MVAISDSISQYAPLFGFEIELTAEPVKNQTIHNDKLCCKYSL